MLVPSVSLQKAPWLAIKLRQPKEANIQAKLALPRSAA